MLPFAYVYFLESGLFNELWAIQKKISPVSASAQSRPKCFSFPFVSVRRRSVFRRLGISIPADFGFGKELSSGWAVAKTETWRAAPSKEALPLQLRCRAE
jgi:hypothetical protein